MPDDIATKDADGFVQVKLDAPNGAELMQPLPNDAGELPQPTAQYVNDPREFQQSGLAEPPGPDRNSLLAELQAPNQPPEVIDITQQLQLAQTKENQAKSQAETALKDIKQLEEQARSNQEQLEKQVEQAKAKLQEAQAALKEARKKQKESQKQFTGIQKQKGTDGKKMGGYKLTQLLSAFAKPPQPETGSSSSVSPVDDETEQKLKSEVKQTDKRLGQTEKQISAASKQADKVSQTVTKFKQRLQNFIENIGALLQNLNGEGKSSTGVATYKPFLFVGVALLVLAAISFLISPSVIWALIALAALVQLAMGSFLKAKAQ